MKLIETPLKGAFVLEPLMINDKRGFFARTWCTDTLRDRGLNVNIAQCNISFNHQRGTIRGMHYQIQPYEETKLIRCTMGAIHDVIIDLRPDSPTHMQHFAVELTAANHRMLYVPDGFAHGFQSLVHHSEVYYQLSESYHPEAVAGIRYDDPAFNIRWPIDATVISDRDLAFAPFRTVESHA